MPPPLGIEAPPGTSRVETLHRMEQRSSWSSGRRCTIGYVLSPTASTIRQRVNCSRSFATLSSVSLLGVELFVRRGNHHFRLIQRVHQEHRKPDANELRPPVPRLPWRTHYCHWLAAHRYRRTERDASRSVLQNRELNMLLGAK